MSDCVPCPAMGAMARSAGVKSGPRDNLDPNPQLGGECLPCQPCCVPPPTQPNAGACCPPVCCEPCPATAAYVPTAGIKSGPKDNLPPDPSVGNECPCHSCCCAKPTVVNPCYKQPRIPESYAPKRRFCPPMYPVEDNTTYKMSYLAVDACGDVRGQQKKPIPNLMPSTAQMEGETIQKLSYLPNPICTTQAIRPCHHDMWGKGPVQNLTTQRHDFVPKPCAVRQSMKPAPKYHCVETPMEDKTINRLSYIPPECTGPPKPFTPMRCYERPSAPMESCTTQKLSYLPNQLGPKECLPWACKTQYQKPCQALDSSTTYNLSYLDAVGDCRRRAIIPDTCKNPVTPSRLFESGTIYRNSYLPACSPIPNMVKPVPNIVPSTAQMEGETVQKLSYQPNPICTTQAIRPCHHDMWGKGPVQNLTTQRHDFVPKPCVVRQSMKPAPKYHCVETPMEDKTTNRLSYLDPGNNKKPTSYRPLRCYEKPCAPMEGCTTQKLSYQPVCAQIPERPPWAVRGAWQRPCGALENTTIYKASFLPPGEDCTEITDPCCYGDCKPCQCILPSECIRRDPCACPYPTAAITC